jgi:hypothetical protein
MRVGFLATFLIVLLTSCEREDYQLQRQMDKRIAKESRYQIDSMKKVMDSICRVDFEIEVQIKLDSIVPARIEEIRQKLNPKKK